MSASNATTVAYIFKRRYSDSQSGEVATREHPTLHMLAKHGGFTGSGFFYPITYGNPQGISSGFTTAQSSAAPIKGVQLQANIKLKYGVITLDGPAMAQADGDKGSFYDFVTRHTDGILEELGANIAFDVFRDGNGQRGRRASLAGDVVTLTDANHVPNFKVGMTVIASANANGSAPRAGSTTVTAISRGGNAVTLASAAAITGFQNNDYLFRAGDPGSCLEGMASCTPLVAPTAGDSFRGGVDRSVDVEALAGSRISDTTGFLEDNIGLGAVGVHAMGKKLKVAAMYPTKFWEVQRRMQAQVQYEGGGGTAEYGFEYILLNTPAGQIKLFSDPDIPVDVSRAWHPDAHYLKHCKEFIHIIRDGVGPQMRSVSADGLEIRARSMLNYVQSDTAAHLVVAA